jgi:hypothetical protein
MKRNKTGKRRSAPRRQTLADFGGPLFPDTDAIDLTAGIVEQLRLAGLPPDFIFAFAKTGMMVTDKNEAGFSKDELAEWDAAIAEYHRLHPGDKTTG